VNETSVPGTISNTDLSANIIYQNDFGANECSDNKENEEENVAQEQDLPQKSNRWSYE